MRYATAWIQIAYGLLAYSLPDAGSLLYTCRVLYAGCLLIAYYGWLGVIGGRSQNGGRGMGEPGRKGLVSPLRWGSQVYSQTRRIS